MAGRGACDKFGHVEMTSARHVVSNERRRCAVYFDLIRPSVCLSVCLSVPSWSRLYMVTYAKRGLGLGSTGLELELGLASGLFLRGNPSVSPY